MRFSIILAAALAALLSACTTVEQTDLPPDPAALCSGAPLGKVVVAPLTHWRPDQKEKERREAIAVAAIQSSFAALPCGQVVSIRAIGPDTQAASALSAAKAAGADTLLTIRVKELGPILIISIPALWSTWSDVKFDLKAETLATGAVRMDVARHRKVGGAFAVRGVGPLQQEFETALKGLIAS